jgi:hypothetical protein
MSDQLYELRECRDGKYRLLLTTPDVARAYQLLTALRTPDHLYEVGEQGGPGLSHDELLELIEDQARQ